MVLTAQSTERRQNVYTNTRSFAKNNAKNVQRFKVRKASKAASDLPQPGYYDTEHAYNHTFGKAPVNSVRMNFDLARKDNFSRP